jgi:hypothetical protein
MKKCLIFAVLGLSVASAKSFRINLTNPAQAGSLQLKAGEYEVVPEQSKVRFVDLKTRTSVETEAKIETGDKKFSQTAVEAKTVNGTSTIEEIDLGGTKMKVEFR